MNDLLIEQLKEYTILCVEDEYIIRNGIVNTLSYYFKEVYEASNANDGYDIYAEYKPDLILSDIEMPKRNGISMVEQIRKDDLDTIIIMLTAYSSEEYLMQLINLNINHYIIKPIDSDSLLNGIFKAFGNRLDEKIEFCDELCFDMKLRELIYKKEVVILRKREKDFLLLLHKNKNMITTYSQIEEELWRDKSMSMSALKTFIKELRHRLPLDIILNIQQEGYKLIEYK
jgi:DNA-binding response OmpR family regulator